MGRKRIRRNYYKNSAAKRRNKIIRRLIFYIKTTAVVTALLVVSFLFIFSYDFITQCDYFRADRLVVTGENRLSEKQVLQQAQIKKGINIFSLNLSKTRKRLLAHSWIVEAEVSRELPSGINIRIQEHKPLAILDLGRKFIINTSGEIFKEMAASDPDHLPIISGLQFSDINVRGKPLSIPFKAVMNVMELGQKSESVLPYKQLKLIQVDREMGLTIYAFDRIKAIKIGYNNYPDKYAKLKNILLYLKKRRRFSHIESIDLNNLNRIVVNPMKRESPAGNHKEV
ncbi:MAG: FtsQ-type POTRA domain-containing protein [Desulfobacteraceae bacterium]|nr:MAG: FtsQ-type POTRA domain-containing protein [Desulfobacteraceae bacterium]